MATEHPPSFWKIFPLSNLVFHIKPLIHMGFPWIFPFSQVFDWFPPSTSEVWLCHDLSLHPRGWGPHWIGRIYVCPPINSHSEHDLFIDDLPIVILVYQFEFLCVNDSQFICAYGQSLDECRMPRKPWKLRSRWPRKWRLRTTPRHKCTRACHAADPDDPVEFDGAYGALESPT